MNDYPDIWFKKDSKARRWLVDNIEMDNSFSRSFRTTGGKFTYYTYEYVMRRCIIKTCHKLSVGSFASNGGARLQFCEPHVEKLVNLQIEQQSPAAVLVLMKFNLPQIISFILASPVFTYINSLEIFSKINLK